MKLYIKQMVSQRCKMLVRQELENLGFKDSKVELGEVDIYEEISDKQRKILAARLLRAGLELMEDKRKILIESIKNAIVEMIYYPDELPKINYSFYLSQKLNQNYTHLETIFSGVTGITIQQFIILNKIERVKELLLYSEYTLSEISYKLNYSSVSHLSNQFKKVTGISPSSYKKMKVCQVAKL